MEDYDKTLYLLFVFMVLFFYNVLNANLRSPRLKKGNTKLVGCLVNGQKRPADCKRKQEKVLLPIWGVIFKSRDQGTKIWHLIIYENFSLRSLPKIQKNQKKAIPQKCGG